VRLDQGLVRLEGRSAGKPKSRAHQKQRTPAPRGNKRRCPQSPGMRRWSRLRLPRPLREVLSVFGATYAQLPFRAWRRLLQVGSKNSVLRRVGEAVLLQVRGVYPKSAARTHLRGESENPSSPRLPQVGNKILVLRRVGKRLLQVGTKNSVHFCDESEKRPSSNRCHELSSAAGQAEYGFVRIVSRKPGLRRVGERVLR